MSAGQVRGEALARTLEARGCVLSAGEAALLADQLLDLIAEGLIAPAQVRASDATTDAAPQESER